MDERMSEWVNGRMRGWVDARCELLYFRATIMIQIDEVIEAQGDWPIKYKNAIDVK